MNKNVFKPWILSFICLVICLCFTACGNQNAGNQADEATNAGASTGVVQDIENIGDDIMNGAEDLLDGNSTDINDQNIGTNDIETDDIATDYTGTADTATDILQEPMNDKQGSVVK